MALDQNKTTKGKSKETNGPAMCSYGGYDVGKAPVNPSDEIFKGRALPMKRSADTVARRSFTEPTRTPKHRSEGPGTDAARR